MKLKMKNLIAGAATGATAVFLTAQNAFAQANQNANNIAGISNNPSISITPPGGFFADFSSFGSTILRIVFVIAAILVFAYLIMGGLEWITSGGEKSKTEAARNKITAAVVGLVILVASWALMNLIISLLTQGTYSNLNGLIQSNLH